MEGRTVVNVLAVVGAGAVGLAALLSAKRLLDWRRNDELAERLDAAKKELEATRERAEAAEAAARQAEARSTDRESTPVRVYIDGCFDMFHFGHSNALRQARAVGDILVVGLVGDSEVIKNKGTPPVIPEDERYECLKACKFADEVIKSVPYDLTPEWTQELITKYNIDYIVHGDDPCITADGKDAYATAKSLGKFKTIKRTEGVSTTDLVGRMLLMSTDHHIRRVHGGDTDGRSEEEDASRSAQFVRSRSASVDEPAAAAPRISQFLPTSRRITQFAEGRKPKPGDTVVYIAGAFDLFNAGHVKALQQAREYGHFLLVGIHDDDTVHQQRGSGFPVMNLHERALSVLSCRFVDEIIMGAPWVITKDVIQTMNIGAVVYGDVSDAHELTGTGELKLSDAYEFAKELGILHRFDSSSPVTAMRVIERVLANREMFQERFDRKAAAERKYLSEKSFVEES